MCYLTEHGYVCDWLELGLGLSLSPHYYGQTNMSLISQGLCSNPMGAKLKPIPYK